MQEKENLNGILLVNKPKGLTSHDVVSFVRRTLKIKKVGHTGTLDPLATGLLVLLLGKYTKLSNEITHDVKEYKVEVKLGIKTDTLDITGEVLEAKETNIDEKELKTIILSFIGKYNQEVPIYSAVKVDGKKLYEYAREGKTVVLPKKEVNILDISSIKINKKSFSFNTTVSSGTYIRSLVRDICAKANILGSVSNLERISVGNYNIKDSYTLEDIENNNFKLIEK